MDKTNFSWLCSDVDIEEPRGIKYLGQDESSLNSFLSSTTSMLEEIRQEVALYNVEEDNGEKDQEIQKKFQLLENYAEQLDLLVVEELCQSVQAVYSSVDAEQKPQVVVKACRWLESAVTRLISPPAIVPQHDPDTQWTNEFKPRSGSPIRCLVVEDEPASRERLVHHLSKFGTCDTASDGNFAVEAVETALKEGRPYDLICLDIMMPNMDGHAALQRIRELEASYPLDNNHDTKIVMTTALHTVDSASKSMTSGCDAYALKPINKQAFHEELRNQGLID